MLIQVERPVEIEIPLEVAGKTVYKDNSNEPDVTLIQAIDGWIADAKGQIDEVSTQLTQMQLFS